MFSPFVRRQRLALELRALREAKGVTSDEVADHIHQARVKISRLENGHIRPDLAEVMNILDLLGVRDPEWRRIMELARDAAAKGWWDKFGDSMGERQRVYADLESGSDTIREYHQGVLPGILQTPDYTRALVALAQTGKSFRHSPERLLQARLKRQQQVLRPDGPRYEVVLDEVGLRRYSSSPETYGPQLRHIVTLAETNPRVAVRVLPLRTGPTADFMPRGPLSIYTFPDPEDPTVVVEPAVTTDTILTQPTDVAATLQRYEHVRSAALSEVSSLGFLSSLADEISNTTGSTA